MGKKKEEGRGKRQTGGKQAYNTARDNANFTPTCNGRSCNTADVINDDYEKGGSYVEKQTRYGNGSSGNPYCLGYCTGSDFQDSDNTICKLSLCGSKRIDGAYTFSKKEGKGFLSKRGSEIVEAAIVLPIFILIVATFVSLSIYYYDAFLNQCDVQRRVLEEVRSDTHIVKRIESNNVYSSRIKGLYRGTIGRDYSASRYALDEGAMIRAGELLL